MIVGNCLLSADISLERVKTKNEFECVCGIDCISTPFSFPAWDGEPHVVRLTERLTKSQETKGGED